jgi:heme-degrading monooxygenase HmoA
MTHVRVASYSVDPGTATEWISDVENGVVPIYKEHAGFKSFSLVDAGDTVVSITHWDSQQEAETASQAATGWAKQQSFIKGQTALHVGEEILTSS